ncbi:UNVERIFIED_CONTAM: BURP domain-containing protein 16 [Sesamum indicum]
MAHATSTFLLLFPFLFYLSFMTSSALIDPFPRSSASTQIKFWFTNVLNKMPEAISTKLSPLTNQDSNYYAEAISENNFNADTEFCSRAKLACSIGSDAYVTALVYNLNKYGGAIPPLEKVDQFSFFRLSTLKEGNVIHLSSLKVSLPYRAFLPSQIASKVPLTSEGIAKIFPQSSKEDIATTLYYCNAAAIKEELKVCPKSLEEMISFSKSALGKNKLLALTSKSTKGSASGLKIKRIKQYDNIVEPSTGAPVNTVVAICHMDTSAWPEEHVAFKIVKLGPGQGEVCLWLSEIDVAWIAGGE